MPQVLIHTLGCKLNSLESESYAEAFANETRPIIIVNTCTVTSKADQKARRVIRKALRDNPDAIVIVTGCYAELEGEEIKLIASRGGAEEDEGAEGRLLVLKREEVLNFAANFPLPTPHSLLPNNPFQFNPKKFSSHTRSFLKIQDGCDNKCTYCRIRLARGPSVSLPAEEVLERLKILETNYAETVLTGVNLSQYNSASLRLCAMLNSLISNTEKIAIRLSSLDPLIINKEFAEVIANNRIRPHFHLSIQSCSETVLKRMGRSYNAQTIENAVSLLRGVKDDPFIACDIITGFPGETEAEFNKTYELCKKLQFAWIHVFPYSKRPGTPAFEFTDSVQESEVTRRVQLLTELAWQGRREYVKRWIGREVEVLLESQKEKKAGTTGFCRGVSENYLKVLVSCKGEVPPPGTVLRCRLIEQADSNAKDYDAEGETLSA